MLHVGHHQALQENQTKFLICLHMDSYYDLLPLLLQQIHISEECILVINSRTLRCAVMS
jgi:hypothetical protein